MDRFTFEDGTYRLSRNVGNNQSALRDTPENGIVHVRRNRSLKFTEIHAFL
jgi:hypothetical protein